MVAGTVSSAAVQELNNAFIDAGGSAPDEAEATDLINSFRLHLKACRPSGDRDAQKAQFAEILRVLRDACEDTCVNQGLDEEQKGLFLWNLYLSCVNRTQGASKFSELTATEESWAEVLDTLASLTDEEPELSYWISKFTILKVLFGLGAVASATANFASSGRVRIISSLLAAVSLGLFGHHALRGTGLCATRAPAANPKPRPVVIPPRESAKQKENEKLQEEVEKAQAERAAMRDELELLKTSLLEGQTAAARSLAGANFDSGLTPMAALPRTETATGQGPSYQSDSQLLGSHLSHLAPPFLPPVPPPVNFDGVKVWVKQDDLPLGTWGTVQTSGSSTASVLLFNGLLLPSVPWASLEVYDFGNEEDPTTEEGKAENVYAPFASQPLTKGKEQASRFAAALEAARSRSSTCEAWPKLFWTEVEKEEAAGGIDSQLLNLLRSHGFIGTGTITAPRQELGSALRTFASGGGPPLGLGASSAESYVNQPSIGGVAVSYHERLPGDLPRAAPEVYRSIRQEGFACLRAWILDMFPQAERGNNPKFSAMYQQATQADFELAGCSSEAELNRLLATRDSLEIILRDFASQVHLRRTNDRSAAEHMRAVRTPGLSLDVAPDWLVSSSSLHSKYETDRVNRGRSGKGGASQSGAGAGAKGTGASQNGKKGTKGAGANSKKGGKGAQAGQPGATPN